MILQEFTEYCGNLNHVWSCNIYILVKIPAILTMKNGFIPDNYAYLNMYAIFGFIDNLFIRFHIGR